MPRMLLVAPARPRVGLTTICLGLVRALDRFGVRVAYAKPIAVHGEDRSVELITLSARLHPPRPISRKRVDELLAAGDYDSLMEEVVALCATAGEGADVVVVEGLVPETSNVYSTRVNALMMKALDSELVLVGSPRQQGPEELASSVGIAARGYGALAEGQVVGCIVNRMCPVAGEAQAGDQSGPLCNECDGCEAAAAGISGPRAEVYRRALEAEALRPLAFVPCSRELMTPRIKDVVSELGARILREGDAANRRVKSVVMGAMQVQNAVKAFRPGALLVTPGDRADVLLAAALAVEGGLALSGVLLTGGLRPEPAVLALCKPALDKGLSLLESDDLSYRVATRISNLNQEIPLDDLERVEATANFVADQIDLGWLKSLAKITRRPRLSPASFRHTLLEQARAADRRIVLPEGCEPRTIAAVAAAHKRGIARCVLMGNPDEIRDQALKQGISLPAGVELLDVGQHAPRYVEHLVARRKHKGLTPDVALVDLTQESILLGTMLVALGEADGLVSGAIHSTAHTIRPALQLIKMVPDCRLVSSVFFMCLPDQVLVFGDCAVNPSPTAEQLADIAVQSADSARAFGIEPRVAMLSYATGASAEGDEVEKVTRATALARKLRPDLLVDGPMQYDAAVMPDVARQKMPGSAVAGQATVFIFPDLNTGNVTYKAVQRSANVVSMGPMLQGLNRPVNDLSRGCLVDDIIFTIALTAIQAQQSGRRAGSAASPAGLAARP